ncbi:MAG: LD-carboxypeptidase [Bacteroidota bacterium]
MHAYTKPPALRPGDTIGLIAPAGPLRKSAAQQALQNLSQLGLQGVFGEHVHQREGYLAGRDSDRLRDLHRFFADPQIAGIWCLRGGYGSMRLLPQLDYELIRRHPKVLIGYSDITALLLAVYRHCGLVCFHGPLAGAPLTDFSTRYWRALLMPSAPSPVELGTGMPPTPNPREVLGPLIGGNLSLLAALAGGPYAPNYKDRIVFLEDIGEKPYRIDRLLTQLRMNGLGRARAILLGQFTDCEEADKNRSWPLHQTLRDRLEPLGLPLYFDLPFGHVPDQWTLPLGIPLRLSPNGRIELAESAVDL